MNAVASGDITVLVTLIYILKLVVVVGNTVLFSLSDRPYRVLLVLSIYLRLDTCEVYWDLFGVATLDIGGTFEIEPQPRPKQI